MSATSRASPRHGRSRHGDSGMVTVEAALALCAFVTVLAMVLGAVSMVLDQIRCTDAAREAARLVARGEQNRATEAVNQIAAGATVSVTTDGDAITVRVRDPAIGGLLPGVHIQAEAYAVREPDADNPTDNNLANTNPPGSHPPTNSEHTTTPAPPSNGQGSQGQGRHDQSSQGHGRPEDSRGQVDSHGRAEASHGMAEAGGHGVDGHGRAGDSTQGSAAMHRPDTSPDQPRRPMEGDRR